MKHQYNDLIKQMYTSFNARKIDEVLAVMDETVDWPNGWEGGYVHGHDEVRAYWTRQWKEIDPEVKPVNVQEKEQGKIEVEVHQIVKDLQGTVLMDSMVKHVYTFDNGKIKRMEIEKL